MEAAVGTPGKPRQFFPFGLAEGWIRKAGLINGSIGFEIVLAGNRPL